MARRRSPRLGSDSVSLGGTGSGGFRDKNVGTGKAVTVSGYTLSGADAGNYTLVEPTGLTANITPASLAITGLTANNKVYDATVAATLSGTATVTALGTDSVSLGGTGSGAFGYKNVGTGKTVTVSGYTLSGADASNYTLIRAHRPDGQYHARESRDQWRHGQQQGLRRDGYGHLEWHRDGHRSGQRQCLRGRHRQAVSSLPRTSGPAKPSR